MNDLILAIETSSLWTAVALREGEKLVSERIVESRSRHNEVLAGLIEELMREQGRGFGDLGFLAVSIGPGSFTALRIGLLTAEGIAFVHSLKIVGVMTLDVLNASLAVDDANELRLPVTDAYKGEVFTALYRGEKRLSDPAIVDPGSVATLVPPEPVRVFGPACMRYEALIRASLGERLRMPEEPVIPPSPGALAKLAWEQKSQVMDPRALEPFYLRRPDAQTKTHDAR